jgi:hypothetical protein
VSFAAITLCVASQRVFVVVYFVIDSIRKLMDIPSYKELCVEVMKSTCYCSDFSCYKHFVNVIFRK